MTIMMLFLALCFIFSSQAFLLNYHRFAHTSHHHSQLDRTTTVRDRTSLYYTVTLKEAGKKDVVMEVDDNTSILEAGIDAGVDLEYDCKLGVCLTCPSRIISGETDQSGSTLDDSVIEKGYALTCMTYPRSDCVIQIIEEDELVDAQFEGR